MIARLVLAFAKVGLFAFGGGYGMIPLFERELVVRHAWISHRQFVDAVVLSQVTPGPIATSTGAIVGYWKAGVWGALAATAAVTLPAAAVVWLLARLVARHGQLSWLKAALKGLRPVVVALMAVAAVSLAASGVWDWKSAGVALATGAAVGVFRVHPILAILAAGSVGIIFF